MHFFIHHLNDFSGSPLILRERLRKIIPSEEIMLITNYGNGFLSDFDGITVRFSYFKYSNRWRRFISLSCWYIRVIFYLIKHIHAGDKITISTLIGSPLLVILIMKSKVIAYLMVNEILFRVPVWRWLGLRMANSSRVHKIYLSKFVRKTWNFNGSSEIIYPTLRNDFMKMSMKLGEIQYKNCEQLKFFLVCSLTEAKGYKLFIDIAQHYDQIKSKHEFFLYLNGNKDQFLSEYPQGTLPFNLHIEFNNSSVNIFMNKDIFLGLTNPMLWVETFGQTFAEAMYMGNIVIVPPLGAQLEYITDGSSGFVFQDYSLKGILIQIERILAHDDLVLLSSKARNSIREFYGIL